ncbi:helix-turn-helix domain-containing protein [Halomonas dongshanensis]|uniref:Helix-turn-helix domain-containing protein n=1 Tax=Halomonas dongshanensis TaxID=2890835 RepID=A0ABT2EG04_9GAMM|nr:helix-turn-helix domain-containing protein [Halomonas dongshanensis]MCS2610419.1 helix-turn-helix domain-containing protein [Halomonas dongshanensis]
MTAFTNIGLYSPKQAERLTGVEADKIRRWLMPARSSKGPLWQPEPQALGAEDTLSFKDLLELRAVAQFRRHNVSLPVIREALHVLRDYLQRDYPLINPQLSTDGKKVFLKVLEESGETAITDLVKRQNVFHDVISPSLKAGIEFDAAGYPIRWQPDPEDTSVVIDPRFAFGKPIVLPSHMPTATLAQAAKVEGSAADAARAYDVTQEEVERAVKFEERILSGALLH